MSEAELIARMHTEWASGAPDLEYTPITDPLPAVVRAEEVAALRARVAELERQLDAVPVDAIRRYFEHSDAYRDVRNGKYEPEQGLLDCQSIAEWLDQQLEPTP